MLLDNFWCIFLLKPVKLFSGSCLKMPSEIFWKCRHKSDTWKTTQKFSNKSPPLPYNSYVCQLWLYLTVVENLPKMYSLWHLSVSQNVVDNLIVLVKYHQNISYLSKTCFWCLSSYFWHWGSCKNNQHLSYDSCQTANVTFRPFLVNLSNIRFNILFLIYERGAFYILLKAIKTAKKVVLCYNNIIKYLRLK